MPSVLCYFLTYAVQFHLEWLLIDRWTRQDAVCHLTSYKTSLCSTQSQLLFISTTTTRQAYHSLPLLNILLLLLHWGEPICHILSTIFSQCHSALSNAYTFYIVGSQSYLYSTFRNSHASFVVHRASHFKANVLLDVVTVITDKKHSCYSKLDDRLMTVK